MKQYIRAAFKNWVPDWLTDDSKALASLNRMGIDLANATFSREPSGRGKDHPIYLVKSDYGKFVWIPGEYNDDEYLTDRYDRNYKAVKYISKKNIPILDIVYVSKKNDANFKTAKERYQDPRYIYEKYSKRPQYGGQYQSDDGTWSKTGRSNGYRRTNRDKSGYVIPDPSDKLEKFYTSDAGHQKLADRLQNVYESLVSLKSDLFNIDFTQFGEYNDSDYGNMLRRFGDACRNYRLALKYLDSDNRYSLSQVFPYVKDIEDDIKSIRKGIETQRFW